MESLLDRGAGWYLANRSLLQLNWPAHVKPVNAHLLKNAVRETKLVQGPIFPHISTEDLYARAWFLIVENDLLNLLLRTWLIESGFCVIFSINQEVVPIHLHQAAVLTSLPKGVSLLNKASEMMCRWKIREMQRYHSIMCPALKQYNRTCRGRLRLHL